MAGRTSYARIVPTACVLALFACTHVPAQQGVRIAQVTTRLAFWDAAEQQWRGQADQVAATVPPEAPRTAQ